jgi:small subunit ribosomal protein S21
VITVRPKKGESDEQYLKRFIRKVAKSGILADYKAKRYFIGKAEQRRLDKKKSIRRAAKKRRERRER